MTQSQSNPSKAAAAQGMSGAPSSQRVAEARPLYQFLILYCALAIAFRILLFENFEIEGASMEPTLLNGDRVVVAKYPYGLFLPFTKQALVNWGKPNPGSVVIVKSPADDVDIVKRVIGVEGDVIEVRQNVVYRNGQPLSRKAAYACKATKMEPWDPDCRWTREKLEGHHYQVSRSLMSMDQDVPPTKVPPQHIYVMGDHRDSSNDSRIIGPVPINRVKGKSLVIYWSHDASGARWHRMFSQVD